MKSNHKFSMFIIFISHLVRYLSPERTSCQASIEDFFRGEEGKGIIMEKILSGLWKLVISYPLQVFNSFQRIDPLNPLLDMFLLFAIPMLRKFLEISRIQQKKVVIILSNSISYIIEHLHSSTIWP